MKTQIVKSALLYCQHLTDTARFIVFFLLSKLGLLDSVVYELADPNKGLNIDWDIIFFQYFLQ